MDYTIKVPTMHMNFTPYAMAKMSDGIFRSAKNIDNVIPAVKYFLYCVSIELGLKASILSKDNSAERKAKNKKINHDLEGAYSEFTVCFNNCLFNKLDVKALRKINLHFMQKGLEYFTLDTIVAHVNGSLPEVKEIQRIAGKVNIFIRQNKFYI